MKNKNKLAACLALTTLLNVSAATLTSCGAKENKSIVSETSIDTEDIIVIDTLNNCVEKNGIQERYLILYKIDVKESPELSTKDAKAIQYQYKDVMDQEYVGVITEYQSRLTGQVKETLFAYANMYTPNTQTVAVVKPTDDVSWYNQLESILYPDYQKNAYEMYELRNLFELLNEQYLNGDNTYDNQEDETNTEEMKYSFNLN